MKKRLLNIEGIINLRDLGGYYGLDRRPVVWGKMYRSAQLDRISDDGVSAMMSLGIKTVVDLRFDDETQRYPTVRSAFPVAEFISWQSEKDEESNGAEHTVKRAWRQSLESGDSKQVREAMRVNYPKKLYSHRGIYREMLLRLIDHRSPLLFHCAAGKDRTGVAAAIILGLLGVSDEDIIEDYLVTQSQVSTLFDTWVAGGATGADDYDDFQKKLAQYPRELVKPVFEADVGYITTLLDYVNKTYSNFEQYALTILKLTPQDLIGLRTNLLEA
ncbi:hypothetical protein NBRC116583_04680 [Arenicella sp. 4NH20-0111]|uniref:tyrosine-protein phosphatase n=1 Tax=Arenicella sp. 4NH20-0111 TaxID=3127648 RepID=UPI00310927D6